jgi:hypothetical protein
MRMDASSSRLLPYAVTLGFLGAGALVGLVIATGNLVMIALVIGAVAGLVLLNALPLAVWLILVGVLLVSGPVAYFFPGLTKISWLFSLLGVFMSGAALLYAAVGREKPARRLPAFVVFALLLMVFAGATAFFSNGSLSEISSGAKRQFQFWGVVFLFAVVPFSQVSVRRWMLFLLGVALVQFPFALYQRIVLVPQVMGFERPGFVPFDIIVGTFEGSMFGGGASAIMAMFQVLAMLGLFIAWREKLIGGITCLLLMVPVVAPLALGETKVVMLLIPVTLLAAYYDMVVKRPLLFAGGALATVLLGGLLAYVYFAVQVSGEMTVAENLRDTFEYNLGERGYYGTGVNRLTAVPYWFQSQGWAEPLRTLFGYGLGSAYGMDGRVPAPGHLFVAHPGMHIDLVTASQILWELGAVGAILFYGTLIGATFAAMRNLREAVHAWDRTLCRVLLASLGASLLMSFYSSSEVVLVTHSFLLALTLGLVAWRTRHGPMAATAADRRAPNLSPSGGAGLKGRKFRHWSAQANPGFAGAGGPAFAGATAFGGAPVGGATAGGASAAGAAPAFGGARPAFEPGAVPGFPRPARPRGDAAGPGDGVFGAASAASAAAPAGTAHGGFAGEAPRPRRGVPERPAGADEPLGPMFATDEELAQRQQADATRRRGGGAVSGRQGRIEPVIDISDVDPIR